MIPSRYALSMLGYTPTLNTIEMVLTLETQYSEQTALLFCEK